MKPIHTKLNRDTQLNRRRMYPITVLLIAGRVEKDSIGMKSNLYPLKIPIHCYI